eukprot:925367-Amphidinium_carterae.1
MFTPRCPPVKRHLATCSALHSSDRSAMDLMRRQSTLCCLQRHFKKEDNCGDEIATSHSMPTRRSPQEQSIDQHHHCGCRDDFSCKVITQTSAQVMVVREHGGSGPQRSEVFAHFSGDSLSENDYEEREGERANNAGRGDATSKFSGHHML